MAVKKAAMDSIWKKAIVGILSSCVAALAISGLMGMLVLKELLPIDAAPVAVTLMMGLCLFIICYVVVRKSTKNRLPLSMVLAAGFSLICVLCKMAFFPMAAFSLGWQTTVPFFAAALAGVLASKKKKVRRRS